MARRTLTYALLALYVLGTVSAEVGFLSNSDNDPSRASATAIAANGASMLSTNRKLLMQASVGSAGPGAVRTLLAKKKCDKGKKCETPEPETEEEPEEEEEETPDEEEEEETPDDDDEEETPDDDDDEEEEKPEKPEKPNKHHKKGGKWKNKARNFWRKFVRRHFRGRWH